MNLSSLLAGLPGEVLSWGLSAGIVGLASVATIRYLGKTRQNRAIARRIRRIAREHLHAVAVPDGLDGFVQIDHLLLMPDRVLVLDVKNFEGMIFGNAAQDAWTQVVGSKSYRFANPVAENRIRVQAVRALAPGAPVSGCVMFTDAARFPKGYPQGVHTLETLQDALAPLQGQEERQKGRKSPVSLDEAWQRIKENAVPVDRLLQNH